MAADSVDGDASERRQSRDRYGRPAFRRTALAPGLLASVALLVGFALIESEAFIVIRFVVAILALIVLVFAVAGAALVVDPVPARDRGGRGIRSIPLDIAGPWWIAAQYVAILVFVLAGIFIKVPVTRPRTREALMARLTSSAPARAPASRSSGSVPSP